MWPRVMQVACRAAAPKKHVQVTFVATGAGSVEQGGVPLCLSLNTQDRAAEWFEKYARQGMTNAQGKLCSGMESTKTTSAQYLFVFAAKRCHR